jgi:hypothetical protein
LRKDCIIVAFSVPGTHRTPSIMYAFTQVNTYQPLTPIPEAIERITEVTGRAVAPRRRMFLLSMLELLSEDKRYYGVGLTLRSTFDPIGADLSPLAKLEHIYVLATARSTHDTGLHSHSQ